jgi:Transposase IS116/IS110/IS902 family
MSDLFGKAGTQLLDHMQLSTASAARVISLRRLLEPLDAELALFGGMSLPGWPTIAATGRSRRLTGSDRCWQRCWSPRSVTSTASPAPPSWVGLTPRHRESDTHVHRGKITKQGSRLARWAAVEAVQLPARNRPQTGRCRDRVSMPSWPPASAMAARRGRERGFSLDRSEQAS